MGKRDEMFSSTILLRHEYTYFRVFKISHLTEKKSVEERKIEKKKLGGDLGFLLSPLGVLTFLRYALLFVSEAEMDSWFINHFSKIAASVYVKNKILNSRLERGRVPDKIRMFFSFPMHITTSETF